MTLRLGFVGAGAVVQQCHLPAAATLADVALEAIADVNRTTLAAAAEKWRISQRVEDYRSLRDIDAVVVATPHALHAEICEHFLKLGVHVLVEKPLTTRLDDARRLISLAQEKGAVLAVGVFRRYYPVSALIRAMVAENWLGGVEEIDAEEGYVYNWEMSSAFLLDPKLAGGGVLLDTGSHLLDRLLWWFEGAEIEDLDYEDDCAGGVEADCELRCVLRWRQRRIRCRVVLSRIRNLRNTIRLQCAEGGLELGANEPLRFHWWTERWKNSGLAKLVTYPDVPETQRATSPLVYFREQLRDFVRAIVQRQTPVNNATSCLPALALIERCYQIRRRTTHPWEL